MNRRAMRTAMVAATMTSAMTVACAGPQADSGMMPNAPASPPGDVTFADDVAFLGQHAGKIDVLEAPNGGRVAVSAEYQARVMTSAVAANAKSLGFVHRAFIEKGAKGTAFDNYGGEDRFWLGPEGGQFGLYFAPGKGFTFDAWQTPHEMQEGAWKNVARDASSLTFQKTMNVVNNSGTPFVVSVTRKIGVLGADDVTRDLGVAPADGVAWVAFQTENVIANAGSAAWTPDKGLVSIWILGMFAPAADARIVIPFRPTGEGRIVNDKYFGEVPADRLVVHDKDAWLSFTADGKHRSKIGISPARAKMVAGSYSASQKLLTIVKYDAPARGVRGSEEPRYVNSMWETQKEPYAGDVINAYNDGPTAPGKPSLGGFYEIETSSPAAALAPGATLAHTHRTFHFVGEPAALDPIARKVLGIPLSDVAR